MNKLHPQKFRAYSAGSQPKGAVNPYTINLLQRLGYDTGELRSKSWDEFTKPGAVAFDFIFTVCDNAANEPCPVFPGNPTTAHWGIPDPAAIKGTEAEISAAFSETYRMLSRRIKVFAALPFASLDALSLQTKLREIGRFEDATAKGRGAS